jgi:RecA-family ATPase
LDDPFVLEAVRQLHKPVVILDTAIRFSSSTDENSSVQNAWMEKAIRSLREAGCIAVVALHHSPKRTEEMGPPTLENTFRGTGDFGALLDVAYSVRTDRPLKDRGDGEQVTVQCVKARDMEDAPARFNLGLKYRRDGETVLRSWIAERGDLVLMDAPESADPVKTDRREQDHEKQRLREEAKFIELVRTDPTISMRTLQAEMRMGRPKVKRVSERLGYEYENGAWTAPPALKSHTEVSVIPDAVEDDALTF